MLFSTRRASGGGGLETSWERITELFEAALSLPEDELVSYLKTRCAGDEAALSEILSLLRASREEGPLDRLERRMGGRDSADGDP